MFLKCVIIKIVEHIKILIPFLLQVDANPTVFDLAILYGRTKVRWFTGLVWKGVGRDDYYAMCSFEFRGFAKNAMFL